MGHVPYVDVASTYDAESRKISLFVFNRDLSKSREVELIWEDSTPARAVDSMTLTGDDLKAFNSFEAPQRVVPRPFDQPFPNGTKTCVQPPPHPHPSLPS